VRQQLFTAWLCIGLISFSASRCADAQGTQDDWCLPITTKHTKNRDCSHTEAAPRQMVYNNVKQHNLGLFWWYHDIICEIANAWIAVQVLPIYQKSTNGKRLARYFLPCCHTGQLSVREDGLGDIGSLWLSLIAADNQQYEGFFTICPERTIEGTFFDIRISLSNIICHAWMDVVFAIERVTHKLNFCPHDGPFPGVACDVATLCQAFNQPDWQHGRLWQGEKTVKGVDDVQIKFGYDWFYCDTNHLSPYLVLGISTRTKAADAFLFPPSIAGGHNSFGFGIIGDLQLAFWDYSSLTLLMDFKYRREFGGRVCRTFDLCKNGDWSRYLLMVTQDEPSNTLPGVNFMTLNVKQSATNTIDWWSALHYQWRQVHIEGGYDLWWHERQTLKLCSFPEGIGIFDLAGQCSNPTSADTAMICQSILNNQPTSDATFTELTPADVNLNSGAVPTRLSSTIYLALGYDAYVCERPILLGVGASYEFGHRTSSLSNWDIWARFGIGF
jgi:hypothetical protein